MPEDPTNANQNDIAQDDAAAGDADATAEGGDRDGAATATRSANETQPVVVLAEYEDPAALIHAAEGVRDAGYRQWDCHSPFPVHGLDPAMGIRPTILPWLALGAGLAGAAVSLLLQWWTNAIDYPFLISGKPYFSLPANIPITFEAIVLLSAFAAFGGAIVLSWLPEYSHPVLRSERFRRATTDGFFVSIEARDPQFDGEATGQLLESLGATHVETIDAAPPDARVSPLVYWAAAAAVVLALLPPLLIARARSVRSEKPRIHPVADMDHQPKYKTQAFSPLFTDRRTMRPPVEGAIARGDLQADDHLVRGVVEGQWAEGFPMTVTEAVMQRGRERYDVYCATCHGLSGDGDGMTTLRAQKRQEPTWIPPVSLHSEVVVQQPVGRIYNTITNGIRSMPAYAAQISVEDRWAIVAYVRALQRSRNASIDDVPAEIRPQLR
jgi:mono/diheme cytochrome c family protein